MASIAKLKCGFLLVVANQLPYLYRQFVLKVRRFLVQARLSMKTPSAVFGN